MNMCNLTSNETSMQKVMNSLDGTILLLYSVLMVAGIMCNTCLVFVVLTQKSAKNRSPLLITLFITDVLVCAISIPVTVHHIRYGDSSSILPALFCKVAVYLQVVPVSASTSTLMALSVDRYVSVRCPQPVGKQQTRHYIGLFLSISCWIFAFSINIPWLFIRVIINEANDRQCIEMWKSDKWKMCYIFVHLCLVYIIPCIVVMICHFGLRDKLTALSLTSRAAKGEMPLPLPVLHLSNDLPFIIIGLTTKTEGKVVPYHRPSMSVGEEERPDAQLLDVIETSFANPPRRKKLNLKVFIKTRKKQNVDHGKKHMKTRRTMHKRKKTKNEPKNNSVNNAMKSRRRMATALVITGALTSVCWIPYIICVLCKTLCSNEYDPTMVILGRVSLFLGHVHSLVNPIVYWAMNHDSLTRCSCPCPCLKHLTKKHPFHRTNSSTNEMALGPFNPKYIKPQIPKRALRRSSSCYLY